MLVKDMMTTSPICCKTTDTLDVVANLMREHDCGIIPVCTPAELVGVITDRDIACRAVATGKTPHDVHVSEVMTKTVYTVPEDANVQNAIDLMKSKQVRRLPVVNADGQVVGIIAPSDLAPIFASMNVADFLLAVSYWSRSGAAAA
jgi:CBS domain-containing protein